MTELIVRAYDHGRSESVRQMGSRLHDLLTGLAAVHPKLSAWSARARDGALRPVKSTEDCATAIESRATTWRTGPREHVAYGPVLVAGGGAAEIGIVCGVQPFPVWTPNQVVITLGASSGITVKEAGTLEAVLGTLARTYAPAWGHVSVDGLPIAPTPPFANGTPVVGWLTFLSRDYPPIPAVLPEPAVARMADKGTILSAHPTRPDAEAIDRLRAALEEARVLVPAIAVRGGR